MTSVATAANPRRGPMWLLPVVWVVLTVALILAVRALPWQRALEQVRHVAPVWVITAIIAYLLPIPLWALEWRLLAPRTVRVAYSKMFEVVAVMAAVLNSIPFFAGETAGVGMLIGRAGLSRGAALSVLALDQLLSGVVKLVVLGTAALLVPLPVWLRSGILALVIGVAVLLAVLVPLAHRGPTIRTRLLVRPSPLHRLAALFASLGEHLDALRETHRVGKVVLLGLAKKAAELLAILAIQRAFGLEPSLAAATLVLAALAIATLMPVAPANIGVYEAVVFAAYRYMGVPAETALGLAVVQHICFLIPTLGTGYVTMTLRQLLPRSSRAA